MTGSELFVHLLLRLGHYADAAVLWVLIKERADVKELKTTSMLIANVQLSGMVDRWTARRSIKTLQERGLISVRIHRKTATLISVDRAAVLDFLRSPLDERLPGLSKKVFPFLDAWSLDIEARCESAGHASAAALTPSSPEADAVAPPCPNVPADAAASIS